MTYRPDSDIPVPDTVVYRKSRTDWVYQLKFLFAGTWNGLQPIAPQELGIVMLRHSGITQMTSMTHMIDIDVYGACGNMSSCASFMENRLYGEICNIHVHALRHLDHVTNKLSLKTEIVPVVYGGQAKWISSPFCDKCGG